MTLPNRASDGTGHTAGPDADLLALLDLLGRRWALRVVWELRTDVLTYRELAARIPEMSTSVLTQRLRDLRTVGLLDHERNSGYRLTAVGLQLLDRIDGLRQWATDVEFERRAARQ